jgi:hypothetical protein
MESAFQIGPKEPSYQSCCEDGFAQVQDFGYKSEDGHSCGNRTAAMVCQSKASPAQWVILLIQ